MVVINRSKVIILFFVIITILLSGHAAQTIFSWIGYLPYVTGMLSIMLLLLIKHEEIRGDTYFLGLMILMVVCTVVVQMLQGMSSYITFFSIMITAFAIARIWSFREMVQCYRVVMMVMTIIALIGYVIVQTTQLLELLPEYENVNEVKYGFSIVFSYIKGAPDRNCGMFWEPGLFATHLALAMLVELLFVEKTSWWRTGLYTVGFLTANSSAGFVLLFLCALLLLVRNVNNGKFSILRNIFALIAVIGAVILIFNFDAILQTTALGDNEYFQKLSTDSVTDSSRIAAFEHNLEIFGENPIFGAGFSKVSTAFERVEDTSTSTYLMSVFGLLGAIYTIAWVYGTFKIKNLNFLAKIVVVAIFLIILNKEPHHRMLFTWCILFYLVGGQVEKIAKKGNLLAEVKDENSGTFAR